MLTDLFVEWSKIGKQSLINHLIEIIEAHESSEVQKLALKCLKENIPKHKEEAIVEIWITHPTPSLRDYIYELVGFRNLRKPLLSAAFVMLDMWNELQEMDPDYKYLDNYLKDLDPLLGSLLFDRVAKLKTPELGERIVQEELNRDEEVSIIDLIRKKEYATLWENILEYPLPFICELFKLFNEENWNPKDKSSRELFEILVEQIGTEGWKGIEAVKWQVISKQKNNKFQLLDDAELRKRMFDLHISQDLIRRPDRIKLQKFRSRGRFNLADTQIGLHIYQRTLRKSDLDGHLHIPIYASNGAELAEFVIPAPSTGSFQMDEDGMFFTVRNKSGLYSFDIDALAALLLPVRRHSEAINEIIPSMLEKANGSAKMTLEALNLISTLHRGREYILWDLKDYGQLVQDEAYPETNRCLCTLGIDLGNSKTKVSLIVAGNCHHTTKTWTIPSIIHYLTPSHYIIGNEVILKKLINSSQTFRNWKYGIHGRNQSYIRIHNTIISAQSAFQNFFTKVIDQVLTNIEHSIKNISITYPFNILPGFETWFRDVVLKLGFSNIEFLDECTAKIVGTYRLKNQRGNVLLIDIGSSQMSAIIAKLPQPKSRKRKEEARMREIGIKKPLIIAKSSIGLGSLDITNVLKNVAFNETERKKLSSTAELMLEDVKKHLSYDFEYEVELPNYEVLNFSLNEKVEGNEISVLPEFLNSEFFQAFKLLLRNILIKGAQRGLEKSKIETVLISGGGMNWPPLIKYIINIFPNKEIIFEDDQHLAAKGAALVAVGQHIEAYLDNDYMLKIVNDGIIGYKTILSRGERVSNSYRTFEIRPQARFERMVLDCWTRKPKFINEENKLPINDTERLEYRKDDAQHFSYDRIYRDLAIINNNAHLKIRVSSKGSLSFEINNGDKSQIFFTNITVS